MRFLILCLFSTGILHSQEFTDARVILEKCMAVSRPVNYGAIQDMKYIDQKGNEKSRRALFFAGLNPEDSRRESQLIYFLTPRALEGSSSLIENYKGFGDEYSSKSWLFSPLFNRVKLNSVSNWRNRSFGTSMTVFDGIHHDLDWFTSTLLPDKKLGDKDIYKIEMMISDQKVREKSSYLRLVRYIDQASLQILKIEAYNQKDELVRLFEFKVGEFDGFWLTTGLKVVQFRSDGQTETTIIDIHNYKLNLELDYKAFFSKRTLKNGVSSAQRDMVLKQNNKGEL